MSPVATRELLAERRKKAQKSYPKHFRAILFSLVRSVHKRNPQVVTRAWIRKLAKELEDRIYHASR